MMQQLRKCALAIEKDGIKNYAYNNYDFIVQPIIMLCIQYMKQNT